MNNDTKSVTVKDVKKGFIEVFQSLCKTRSAWQVWADYIVIASCSIANTVYNSNTETYREREAEYSECLGRFDGNISLVAELLSYTMQALELDPEQDFLGDPFMQLELHNHWKGQFFTPHNIGKMMSLMSMDINGLKESIDKQGYVSISDCACGAGSLLIASANRLRESGVNYQQKALFVAQDIDRIAGLMCYIQLSILGCAGYVVIADTISNPTVYINGDVLFPRLQEGQEIWITPMFFSDEWTKRQRVHYLNHIGI